VTKYYNRTVTTIIEGSDNRSFDNRDPTVVGTKHGIPRVMADYTLEQVTGKEDTYFVIPIHRSISNLTLHLFPHQPLLSLGLHKDSKTSPGPATPERDSGDYLHRQHTSYSGV